MKKSIIRSTWLAKGGYRLDCSPYLGGALEAQVLLEELAVRKDPLGDVTSAILNIGRIKRQWVESPELGTPFLAGSSIQQADLSNLSLISNKAVRENPWLLVKRGTTLITRSGSIGKMAYVREEMEGLTCTEDVLRVVPNTAKIPSGYLYAYLSSKFGIPLIASGTYGAIIQHLEPEHISGLPVPRFGAALEKKIHDLIEEAGSLRSDASSLFETSLDEYHNATGLKKSLGTLSSHPSQWITVSCDKLSGRLDTNFHRAYHVEALHPFAAGITPQRTIRSLAQSIIEPARFKRIEISDPSSVGLCGTGSLADVDPKPMYRIAGGKWVDSYRVDEQTLLIPRSGQIYGIIGRCYQPIGEGLHSAVTEDAIRINCIDQETAGYLYLALSSPFGLRQLKARCFGGSIPTLDVANVASVLIPALGPKERKHLGSEAYRVATMRTEALEKESKARELLVRAIESNAS